MIYDIDLGIDDTPQGILLAGDANQSCRVDDCDAFVDLLEPVFKRGQCIQEKKSIHVVRDKAMAEADLFYKTHEDKAYPVSLEKKLYELKIKIKENIIDLVAMPNAADIEFEPTKLNKNIYRPEDFE